MTECNGKTEIYSRVCGYMRPTQYWNAGKKAEFEDRKEYDLNEVKDLPESLE